MKNNAACFLMLLLYGIVPDLSRASETVLHQENHAFPARQWDVVDIRFPIDALPEKPTDVDFSLI